MLTGLMDHEELQALVQPALREFTAGFNAASEEQQSRAARTIEFLLGLPDDSSCRVDPLAMIDDTLHALAPRLRDTATRVHVLFEENLPAEIEVNANGVMRHLFEALLLMIRSRGGESIRLQCYFADNRLTFSLDEEATGRSFACNPVDTVTSRAINPAIHQRPFALVQSEIAEERKTLAARLQRLGISVVTDFHTQAISFCVITDIRSDAFLAIAGELPDEMPVFLLNNRSIPHKLLVNPNWIQLPDPLNQWELSQAVERAVGTRTPAAARRILLVDDSIANRQLLAMQLGELGHEVSEAASGEDALAMIAVSDFDLVFMDIQLPGISGEETIAAMRLSSEIVPVIALTAHATDEETRRYLETGADEVFTKPLRLETLNAILQHQGTRPNRPKRVRGVNQRDTGKSTLPVFDLQLSLDAASGRPELAAELLEILTKDLAADVRAVTENLQDLPALKQFVHKLHGAVRYCGLPRLMRTLENLERAIKSGSEEDIALLVNLLHVEANAVMVWYRDYPDPFSRAPSSPSAPSATA